MKRVIGMLGRTPTVRRVVAAVLLFGAAGLATALRADSRSFWFELVFNAIAAASALAFLHVRWRKREEDELNPEKVRDIFS